MVLTKLLLDLDVSYEFLGIRLFVRMRSNYFHFTWGISGRGMNKLQYFIWKVFAVSYK